MARVKVSRISVVRILKIDSRRYLSMKWDSSFNNVIINPFSEISTCIPLPSGTTVDVTDLTLLVETVGPYANIALAGRMTENVDFSPYYEFPITRLPVATGQTFRKKKELVWFRVELQIFIEPVSLPQN